MNISNKKLLRSNFFHKVKKRQPYNIQLMGIELLIEKDVFPPDISATTLYLAETIISYKNITTALDMGCGSGFLALFMKKCGIEVVWAADIHSPAIICTQKNITLNKELTPIHVIQSDLFSKINNNIFFDLVVFNHPYYPTVGKPVFGYNPDGGEEILTRFFQTMPDKCHMNSKILLPFSSMSDNKHDPAEVIKKFRNLKIRTVSNKVDKNGDHKIYEITFK